MGYIDICALVWLKPFYQTILLDNRALNSMAFLTKAVRPSPLPAIYNFKHNSLISYAAMSTISDSIKKDHKSIKEYAENIRMASDNDSKTRWQNQFTWELARHSIGEELVVYPGFAKHLGAKGQEMADKDRQEHQLVKDALFKFQKMKPEHAEFIPTLEALMKDLKQHITEEENDDLPALESAPNNKRASRWLNLLLVQKLLFLAAVTRPPRTNH